MRRLLSFVLAAVLFLSVAGGLAEPQRGAKQILFTYQSDGKGDISADYNAVCYYTDDYFSGSSMQYDPSLSTMSVSLSMAAFSRSAGGMNDYSRKCMSAAELLTNIGIPSENIRINNDFMEKPDKDSLGIIAGSKPLHVNGRDYTLIAAAIRGGHYEAEWASNFTLGTDGPHEGFEKAKDDILSFLGEYIRDRHITGPVKLWITGYSRGAAAANMAGGAIDEGAFISSGISYSPEDVYVYCFECPAGVLERDMGDPALYKNIFNIINPNDPVTYVAPAAMGFRRYGTDMHIPTPESSPEDYSVLKSRMLMIYNSLQSTENYNVDTFCMKKFEIRNWLPGGKKISFIQDDKAHNIPQGEFLKKCINILANEVINSREDYVKYYQADIRDIFPVIYGGSAGQTHKVFESFVRQAKDGWENFVLLFLWDTLSDRSGNKEKTLTLVVKWLGQAMNEAGITDYDKNAVDNACIDLANLLFILATKHPKELTTFIMNVKCIINAHRPELCYSWLASVDPNYY